MFSRVLGFKDTNPQGAPKTPSAKWINVWKFSPPTKE